ncbi:MAG: class I SAM-dependent methyltransferase [Desulfobacterales bacterium]|nr:class I SAM-dependent methyltransferase [Desulfobacterales bacterium]
MISCRFVRLFLLVFCFSVIAAGLFAQGAASSEYQPEVNQAGKDVQWVPTCQVLVDKMLDTAKVTPQDYVIDLGSGDGRLVITAAKRGARALGIEYDGRMVALSKENAANAGLTDKARFVQADLFESDFTQATVITMFLLEDLNLKLRPQILALKPGTRVVSNSFTMGEWKPDQTISVLDTQDCETFDTAYSWIVPANVKGTWRLAQGELTLKQEFQMFSGTLHSGANAVPVTNGTLSGDLITFTVGNANYTGRVSGSTMEGTYEFDGHSAKWNAAKVR